jgi:hypothetical protein
MRLALKIFFAAQLLCWSGHAQGFVNLNFENAVIHTVFIGPNPRYTATILGWTVNTPNYVNGDPNSIPFNEQSLGSAAVILHGTNSLAIQPVQGRYSIFLEGGIFNSNTNGASISQTAQIPVTSQSIIFWGTALQATFNGQMLSFIAVSNTPNYTVWGASISAYAGQSGQLSFTAPWQSEGLLDNIQFSSAPIPEPSPLALAALGVSVFCAYRRRI